MRSANRWIPYLFAVGLIAGLISCTGGNLDDGDTPNVVLLVQTLPQIPPVTASPATGGAGCIFVVPPVTASLENKAKSALATERPFNDVVLDNLVITYNWRTAGLTTPRWVQPIAGTVPANGTASVTFSPIQLQALSSPFAGHTADLNMVFNGHTVDGSAIQATAGAALGVNSCQLTSVCGNGVIESGEQCDDGRAPQGGDGCSLTCQIEVGWECVGQPSVCQLIPPGSF